MMECVGRLDVVSAVKSTRISESGYCWRIVVLLAGATEAKGVF